jgi:hypothetical protein
VSLPAHGSDSVKTRDFAHRDGRVLAHCRVSSRCFITRMSLRACVIRCDILHGIHYHPTKTKVKKIESATTRITDDLTNRDLALRKQ